MGIEGIQKALSYAVYPREVVDEDIKLPHTEAEQISTRFLIRNGQIKSGIQKESDLQVKLNTAINKVFDLDRLVQQTGTDCQIAQKDLMAKNDGLTAEVATKKETITSLLEQVEALKLKKDMPPLPESTMDRLLGYYSKYPEANIFSNAHYFGQRKQQYNVFVQNWCTIGTGMKEINNFITAINAWVWKIMRDETDGDFHRACDISVARIARATPVKYVWDTQLYGVEDYWAFANESFFQRNTFGEFMGDCDCLQALRSVIARTAGVPDLLQRHGNGNTRGSGEGHATNYYFASDLFFHHINSTTTFDSSFLTATQAPRVDDPDDPFGLRYVWYSYNAERSWAGIVTSAQGDAIEKSRQHRLMRKVHIFPKGVSP